MAQCPQCASSPLVHTMLAEHLAAYGCGSCLGTLVSLVAYRAWRESEGGRDALAAMPPAQPGVEAQDSIGAKNCPKCRSLMTKYRIRADRDNRLDYCPHCEEVWLDDGEWQLVESLAASGDFARVFTQAWQHHVRTGVSQAMAERRLRDLLGADYARVSTFSDWLRSHPARQEILNVLARG